MIDHMSEIQAVERLEIGLGMQGQLDQVDEESWDRYVKWAMSRERYLQWCFDHCWRI